VTNKSSCRHAVWRPLPHCLSTKAWPRSLVGQDKNTCCMPSEQPGCPEYIGTFQPLMLGRLTICVGPLLKGDSCLLLPDPTLDAGRPDLATPSPPALPPPPPDALSRLLRSSFSACRALNISVSLRVWLLTCSSTAGQQVNCNQNIPRTSAGTISVSAAGRDQHPATWPQYHPGAQTNVKESSGAWAPSC
jgi:hypothetical protein